MTVQQFRRNEKFRALVQGRNRTLECRARKSGSPAYSSFGSEELKKSFSKKSGTTTQCPAAAILSAKCLPHSTTFVNKNNQSFRKFVQHHLNSYSDVSSFQQSILKMKLNNDLLRHWELLLWQSSASSERGARNLQVSLTSFTWARTTENLTSEKHNSIFLPCLWNLPTCYETHST